MRCHFGRVLALGLAVALATANPLTAHSLHEVEARLSAKEAYAVFAEKPAPDFALLDIEGRPVTPADLAGQVVVLHFIFASCTDLCPLHTAKLVDAQRHVNATPMRDQVRFVAVTTDPERDTPDVLRAYGAAHGVDPDNWMFLTSGPDRPDATRALAASLGARFDPTPDGQQLHGAVTYVLDGQGRRRADYHGVQFETMNLVLYLNALVNDVYEPPHLPATGWWGWLKGLFSSDPTAAH